MNFEVIPNEQTPKTSEFAFNLMTDYIEKCNKALRWKENYWMNC